MGAKEGLLNRIEKLERALLPFASMQRAGAPERVLLERGTDLDNTIVTEADIQLAYEAMPKDWRANHDEFFK